MEHNVNLVIKILENVNTVILIIKLKEENVQNLFVIFVIKKYFQMKHVLIDILKIM